MDIIGRVCLPETNFRPIDLIKIVGPNIRFIRRNKCIQNEFEGFSRRLKQTFGDDTYNKLRNLKIAVVGCSGTGSFVIEHLARLGVGCIILVDPDTMEVNNLNRIPNSTMDDAVNNLPKVCVFERAIKNMGIGTQVKSFQANLYNFEIIEEMKNVDLIFGCMDSIDGRHLLNKISNFYLLPYFDLGVKLIADGNGGINNIVGTLIICNEVNLLY